MGLSQAYLTSRSSKDAANTAARAEERAAQMSIDEQRRQFDLTRADQAPWLQAGQGALNQLMRLYGIGGGGGAANDGYTGPIDPNTGQPIGAMDAPGGGRGGAMDFSQFLSSPDYQFALQQGEQATQRAGSAMGNLRSGNTLAALTQYGQGLASQQLGNYTNRLAQLAGVGQQSANQLGQLGANMAGNIGNAYANAGNARASGILNANVAQQNAYNQSSQNTLGALSMMGWMGYGRG